MKILLTGATGFIGTNFILQLYGKYELIALVRRSSNINKIKDYCKIYYYDGTIDSIEDIFKKEKIDGVVHLASIVPTTMKPSNDIVELIYANIILGTFVVQNVKKYNVSFFINTTTYLLYSNSLFYLPFNLYAATKKAFEDIMYYFALISNSVLTNILLFNIYGNNDPSTRLFQVLDKISKTNEELLMSDGTQIVDYSHIYDVINGFDCLIELIQKDPEFCKNKIFSLKGKERKSLKEVVMLYEEVLGKKLNIKWGARPQRDLEIMIPWEGGEKLPNWEQKISLREGFVKMINEK
ncbi:NAD-dependent epimerase/dehydratase family protein [Campylobacter coli]|nr:NAD-dependent epimerase/dehydratase family protein [Campylobacter jejuni]ECQ5444975.1 NAD-dependent epimerase/dehydratase family protein [Campylobacter coli]EDO9104197.1 NAD-dependent epimerase/dehydratase family protein [Campylobacter coli]HEG5460366.1 NAD-dependent epimerase/dehydratase family protein [Campylobacter coli]